MDDPCPLPLTGEEREAFRRGVDEFNQGRFFDCHDTLEDLWQGTRGPERDFLQGLIQVAVAFHHLGNFNPAGARSVLRKALGRLAPYPARCYGFDLAAHRRDLEAWVARLESGEADEIPRPRWDFDWEAMA